MSNEKYTTRKQIKQLEIVDWQSSFDNQVNKWISAMSRYIDKYCNVVIYEDEENTNKYDGNGEKDLMIDTCHDISEVTIDGTVITPHEYPANDPGVYLLKRENKVFTEGTQNVEVTAKFSKYDSVPEDLDYACAVLVAGIINEQQMEDKRGLRKDIGNFSVQYSKDAGRKDLSQAENILDKHRMLAI